MATLAIKGHPTRGSEVIALLRMLGGMNFAGFGGLDETEFYGIEDGGITQLCDWNNCICFTLEEFEEKFPYKVGDKVTLDKFPCTIKEMSWDCDDIIYYVQGVDFSKGVYSKDKDLQPYKEETMETITIDDFKANTKEWLIDKLHGMIISDAIKTIGNIHNELHKPKYPKTYKECCNVLGLNTLGNDAQGYKWELIIRFQELLIARDAYLKIAKDWKPDYTNPDIDLYVIINVNNNIEKAKYGYAFQHCILTFPTAEMRNAFYENFKDLIEQCKELL